MSLEGVALQPFPSPRPDSKKFKGGVDKGVNINLA